MRIFSLMAASIVVALPAVAQNSAITTTGTLHSPADSVGVSTDSPAAPLASATSSQRVMPSGTMVQLTPTAEISSKKVEEGQSVAFVTVADVMENDFVVVPRGSLVEGTVVWKTGRAIGGKSGKFEIRFDKITVRGKQYALSGQHRQEGRGNTTGALLGSIWISGRSAVMLPGQVVNAFTAAPVPY